MSVPLMSICIPTYEMHGKGLVFLQHALESIKKQEFTQFEVIVSDNSKDDLIKHYCETVREIPNLIYVRNNQKFGISANINFAIRHAQTELVKILFQDDFLYGNDALGKLYRVWKDHDRRWLLSASEHSHDGKNLYFTMIPKYHNKIYLGSNTISSPSVLMLSRKDAPVFDESLTWLMDCDYYKMCFDKLGLPAICEEVTVVNRVGAHQVSQTGVTRKLQLAEVKYIMQKYASEVTLYDRIKTFKYRLPGWLYGVARNWT